MKALQLYVPFQRRLGQQLATTESLPGQLLRLPNYLARLLSPLSDWEVAHKVAVQSMLVTLYVSQEMRKLKPAVGLRLAGQRAASLNTSGSRSHASDTMQCG